MERELGLQFSEVSFPEPGTAGVPAEVLPEIANLLKTRYGFAVLTSLTAVDYRDHFKLVYHLVRPADAALYVLEVGTDYAGAAVPSLTGLWRSALWQEREVFDLFGITFTGHPDLRRILLEAGFTGHPLRKNFVMPKPGGK